MRCFKCAEELILLAVGDPARQSKRVSYADESCGAFVLDVVGGGPEGGGDCRAAVVCWTCFHAINPDMWDSGEYWDSRQPAVRFEGLPPLDHDAENCEDIETYADKEYTAEGEPDPFWKD